VVGKEDGLLADEELIVEEVDEVGEDVPAGMLQVGIGEDRVEALCFGEDVLGRVEVAL